MDDQKKVNEPEDFAKLVEQAKLLSQLMGMDKQTQSEPTQTTEPVHSESPDPSMANIEKAVRVMQMFQAFSEQPTESEPNAEPVRQPPEEPPEEEPLMRSPPGSPDGMTRTDTSQAHDFARLFDQSVNTSSILAMKAALPYMEAHHQKTFSLWIKFCEIQKLMDMYRNQTQLQYRGRREKDWRRGMLLSIRPHMEETNRRKIDLLLKALELKEIMENLNQKI
jgi:hypothetical protein